MRSLSAIYQLVRGDFFERTRRYSFLVTVLATLFFGYLVITGKWVLRLGEYRGLYNSAWVGSIMASASAIMLAFFGFYLVKNSISRDRRTGVGEILAATPLRTITYLVSKFLSNLAVLTSMMTLLMGMAAVMQFWGGVEGGFQLWALVAPFLFVCLPVLALVSAFAVLFESVPWLRGTIGNVLYLIVAEFAFINNMLVHVPLLDFGGFGLFIPSMEQAALAAYPGAELGFEMGFIIGGMMSGGGMKLFPWEGIDWSLGMVPLRLLWVGWALGLVGLGTLWFDRFDPARGGRGKPARRRRKAGKEIPALGDGPVRPAAPRSWGEIVPARIRFNGLNLVTAELQLMLKGFHWSWYLVAVGLLAAQLALPYQYARTYALPVAMIWPLALWSGMGTREARFNTGQLVFVSAHPMARQLPSVWVSGLVVTLLAGSGMLLRAALAGEVAHAGALLAGMLLVPTFALALGTVSGSRKLFEVIYLLAWYIGPLNGVAALDFVGTSEAAAKGSMPLICLGGSLVLGVIAVWSRRRQVAGGLGKYA